MKRKPSAKRLAKGLERAAHQAEWYASKLSELGLERAASGASSAARELSYAADRAVELAERAQGVES